MKQQFFFLLLIVGVFGLMACKNTQKNGTTPPADGTVRLSVSFYSIGSGINHEVQTAYLAKIAEFNKTNGVEVKPDVVNWGREGETDYCFALTGIKTKLQDAFVAESKAFLEGKEHVRITENVACRKPRN